MAVTLIGAGPPRFSKRALLEPLARPVATAVHNTTIGLGSPQRAELCTLFVHSSSRFRRDVWRVVLCTPGYRTDCQPAGRIHAIAQHAGTRSALPSPANRAR